ncbi:hypothetical protein GCM10007886_20640 [Methylobacterium gregans]|uniref:Uncharacterized protein n=2 Tax=Methylobacterium gregans TaxID=374424 RepID=A0AA37HPZ2_9HYPH|nr:hypothetical protein NBEOAGPD_2051 [Methylobacterium gregans]GLS53881.1 hypothetical protein GCM10007886_20640 [Methylobacterium gregans]
MGATRRAPQSAEERATLKDELDAALWTFNRIQSEAGPTLRKDIGEAERFRMSYALDELRRATIRQRLSHRAGILRLMRHEIGQDDPPELTDRSRLYLDLMLCISAHVGALSDAGWTSALRWFERRLPALVAQITPKALAAEFERHRSEAGIFMAGTITSTRSPFHWGPRPGETATALQTTTAQLRAAGANRSGLTSVDPESRKQRDRKRKERQRREAGMKLQSERTKTAERKALAERLGCHPRTIQRHKEAGTLAEFVAGRNVAKVSTLLKTFTGDRFATPPLPDNDDQEEAPQPTVKSAA